MSEQLADGNASFARQSKLGPVFSDSLVQLKESTAVCNDHCRCGHSFSNGEDECESILVPKFASLVAAVAAPQINDLSSLVIDGASGAFLVPLGKVSLKFQSHLLKFWRDHSVDCRPSSPIFIHAIALPYAKARSSLFQLSSRADRRSQHGTFARIKSLTLEHS